MKPQLPATTDPGRRIAVSECHAAVTSPKDRHPDTARANGDRDGALVEALRLGEPRAAERLLSQYGRRAYRLAIGITGSRQDAEEVVQDAFWAVVRKIDTFRGDAAFGSWLHRIVANTAYQKFRGRQGRRADLSLDEVLPGFDEHGRHVAPGVEWSAYVDDVSSRIEVRIALTFALDELQADYRAVLLLRDIEGLSHREIAEALSISVPNVKTRGHRARLFLRKRLSDSMMRRAATTPRPSRRSAGGLSATTFPVHSG